MSNSSVITNEDGGIKRGYSNNMVRPKFAILNPELTMTLPDFQTACGCTDIMMHTMERYFTSAGNMELTDGIAEALLRTVIKKCIDTSRRSEELRSTRRGNVGWKFVS